MDTIEDRRSIGAPEIAYSAYCQVCWFGVYQLSSAAGVQACVLDCKNAQVCAVAQQWARSTADFIKIHRPSRSLAS